MADLIRPVLFSIIILLLGHACVSDPNFAVEPELEYIGISKNQMQQNSLNTDSLFLHFSFTDGDGDIGSDPSDFAQNLVVTDNRTGKTYDSFKLPTIPVLGASKGVTGEVTLRVFTTCCIFPDPTIPQCESPAEFPTDTLMLDIQLFDRGMNASNVITTEPIIILCN